MNEASGRKEHLLRLLAPQASALRAMRQGGTDELERFAREAAQLRMLQLTLPCTRAAGTCTRRIS